jgi:hypothetical protein
MTLAHPLTRSGKNLKSGSGDLNYCLKCPEHAFRLG